MNFASSGVISKKKKLLGKYLLELREQHLKKFQKENSEPRDNFRKGFGSQDDVNNYEDKISQILEEIAEGNPWEISAIDPA